ncbi:siroheme synthase CysG [Neisseria perflava]|uniref:siroheme synthase CysG n=1 Tax=Neisseria perflava TaxID=33053 RepID=UPI0020A195A5|nr:siroheme synthase CysG [Neisseria perflava]MCP1661228.1 uroporphyrin-III C-methyltransferase/precorrin-2 dehydrogenase/sirohydrochlorin ferrochelatase [Neisseria perflava]MCP1773280.1 uroporphyrin-III C-methyltransferase/precorrin-2 dehydrogenase/sirohydrochlorin ferrochelatase [Neisseria perflava]
MNHYPIFADLRDRPVLLAGAGKVAERKAESLLQAGAQVRVVAETLSPVFQTWLDEGKINWLGSEFHDDYLNDVFLAIAATDNHAFNSRVFQAAEARGKFCNTVDTADLCSFIVPAVIDRSPIKVAISSGGTSPVLARKWRQIIETLLPLHTGKMAAIAGKWRSRVKAEIQGTEQRRRFWEHLFDSRFNALAAQGNLEAAEAELAAQLDGYRPSTGEVVLVGAGPGDAGLLTIHALQAIQAADVVLYDALVSDEILGKVRKDADKISVGKRAGCHHVQQEETNRLLVQYAQAGKRVVRLKGGDPFVFGRGGEEAQVLRQAGISYRIVPGVTAALGATAYAGIPLTHRDCAQSALFVTAHSKHDGQQPDWRTLALSHQTLVVYMGTLKASEITEKLIEYGRSADTPVAIVSNGTLPQQSVQTGRLKDLPAMAERAPRPALMVIGEVAALRDELKWFGENEAAA